MPGVFDPGNGLLSSFDERVVALVALVPWASPFVASERHDAILVAVPVNVVVSPSRRRGE